MITLHQSEYVIRSVHRHWIVIAGKMTVILLLLLPVPVVFFVLAQSSLSEALFLFSLYLISLYAFVLAIIAFMMWMDYFLDIWIITNKRIIDIEQVGLFQREVSEFLIEHIQDVTTHHPSFLAIMLKYGTIRVHTAGEHTFTAYNIPNIQEVKRLIITEKMGNTHQSLDS